MKLFVYICKTIEFAEMLELYRIYFMGFRKRLKKCLLNLLFLAGISFFLSACSEGGTHTQAVDDFCDVLSEMESGFNEGSGVSFASMEDRLVALESDNEPLTDTEKEQIRVELKSLAHTIIECAVKERPVSDYQQAAGLEAVDAVIDSIVSTSVTLNDILGALTDE